MTKIYGYNESIKISQPYYLGGERRTSSFINEY
nr:MAG TPA: hypothetical protein [Caudoviricetes sp.]